MEGEEGFREGALEDIVKAGPAIANQALTQKRVEKNQERGEEDFAAQALGEAELGRRRVEQMLRFEAREAVLFLEPAAEGLAVIVIDPAGEVFDDAVELHKLS